MRTVVAAPDELWEELTTILTDAECIRVKSAAEFKHFSNEDVFFDLFEHGENAHYHDIDALIFINSPINTLQDNNRQKNVFRLNCWQGFLRRSTWEIVGTVSNKLSEYFVFIKREFTATPDVPGFISTRILSMIINEAYFTLDEGVSSKQEIDVAMKLGTNYPKGPFEWSKEIGLINVLNLLMKLSEIDERYKPAPLLIKESLEA